MAKDGTAGRLFLLGGVLCLLLLSPVVPKSASQSNTSLPVSGQPSPAQAANAPSAANPVVLTNTQSDNFFLSGRNSIIGSYYLPYASNNEIPPPSSDDTSKASGVSVAWANTLSGQIAFSRPTSSGGLEPYNVSLSPGEQLYDFTPGTSNVPAQQDNATILAAEMNSATGASGYTLFDTSAGKQFDLPSMPQFYDYGTGGFVQPTPSSWGDNLVGVSDITLPGTDPNGSQYPVVLQYDLTPGTDGYGTWQQVSPSDWTAQTGCVDNTPQVFRPTVPIQAVANGPDPSDFIWARIDLSFVPCLNSIYDGTFDGVDLGDGGGNATFLSFKTNATSYQGSACTPSWAGNTCFEGLVGAWGNIVLYSVSTNIQGSDDLWLYDLANGHNVLLQTGVDFASYISQAGGWIPGFWSDGENFIMIGLDDKVTLYEGATGAVQTFNTRALLPGAVSGLVRVSGGWAVWLNSNDTLNFYNLNTSKLYATPVDTLNPDAQLSTTNFDFEDGVAAWVEVDNYPSPEVVLYTFNATAALNGDPAGSRTVLDWAAPPPPLSLTFPQVTLSSSASWVFLDTPTAATGYYQIAAFATPPPSCTYTAVLSGVWQNSSIWAVAPGALPSSLVNPPSGCSMRVSSGVSVTIPKGLSVITPQGSSMYTMNATSSAPVGGSIINQGTLVIGKGSTLADGGIVSDTGNFTVEGTLTVLNTPEARGIVSSSGTLQLKGTVYNYGTITSLPSVGGVGSSVTLQGSGQGITSTFFNYGLVDIGTGSQFTVAQSAVFNSSAASSTPNIGVVNKGTVVSYGTFDIYLQSSMTNAGSVTNEKQGNFLLQGTMNQNATDAVFQNYGLLHLSAGRLTNDGKVTNDGSVTVDRGSYIINLNGGVFTDDAGTVTSAGTIANRGTLNNEADDTITNQAGGTLDNEQTLNNTGTIDNLGTINNNGTISNAGSISNTGTISNSGTINNSGTLSGSGTITGNQVSTASVSSASSSSLATSTGVSSVSAASSGTSTLASSSSSAQATSTSSSIAIRFSSLAALGAPLIVIVLVLLLTVARRRRGQQVFEGSNLV